MGVSKELFGKTKEGQEIYKYWLSNSKGMKAGIINYGAILVNLFRTKKEIQKILYWDMIILRIILRTAAFLEQP